MRFTALITKEDGWFVGSVVEVPGVHTQGKTRKELKENLKDALQLVLDHRREEARKRSAADAAVESITVEVKA